MQVLFIGDSLVRGNVGVNWVSKLARQNPAWHIENAGVNGDTIFKVRQHLERKLAERWSYDVIVLVAGTNDILIPSLRNKGAFFSQAARYLINEGYKPSEQTWDFEAEFRQTVDLLQTKTNARIILTTLGCLNEDLSSPLNDKRSIFNTIIRETSNCKKCLLADIGARFDDHLREKNTRNYFIENFLNTTYLDKIKSKLGRADALSHCRKLHLTIDGVHLNTRGANIFLNEIQHLLSLCDNESRVKVHYAELEQR